MSQLHNPLLPGLITSVALLLAACESPPPEPTPEVKTADPAQETAKSAVKDRAKERAERPKRKIKAKPPAEVKVSEDDPVKGKWTLEDATAGLAGTGGLVATIKTDQGDIECKLFDDKAPITVANFVGLARGLRPWKKGDAWVKEPAYDNTLFHRIIKGFMIQGGSQNGSEETGYVIPDEIWEDANHDRGGLLCMANRGHNTNSKQFFITHAAAAHLDNNYTIFGECTPLEVVDKLANSPVKGDKAVDPPKIASIAISRKGDAAAAPAASASASPSASASAAPSASAKAAPSGSAAPKAGDKKQASPKPQPQ